LQTFKIIYKLLKFVTNFKKIFTYIIIYLRSLLNYSQTLRIVVKLYFRYLKIDVILLSEVIQEFREFSLNYYGIEPLWFYGSPGLSQAACLKFTQAKCELLRNNNELLWWESAIRGG